MAYTQGSVPTLGWVVVRCYIRDLAEQWRLSLEAAGGQPPAFFFCSLYVVAVPASNRPHSQLQFRTAIHRSAQPVNSTKSCLNAANEDFTYKWANCLQPIWCIFLRIFFYQVFFTDSIDVLPDIYLAMQREHFSCLSWPS